MHRSLPLPPLAVSRLSPSATLILSRPVPPLTSSRSRVYLLAKTRSSPPLSTMSSLRPSPSRSRTLSLSPEAMQGSTLLHWTSAPSASAAAAARGTSTATRATITISLRICFSPSVGEEEPLLGPLPDYRYDRGYANGGKGQAHPPNGLISVGSGENQEHSHAELRVGGVLRSWLGEIVWCSAELLDWWSVAHAAPQTRRKGSCPSYRAPPTGIVSSRRAASRRSRSLCSLSLANSASGCSSQVFILNSISLAPSGTALAWSRRGSPRHGAGPRRSTRGSSPPRGRSWGTSPRPGRTR